MTSRARPRPQARGGTLARLSVRLLVPALLLIATLMVAGRASAQLGGVTIGVVNETSLPRLDKSGNVISKRAQNLTPEAVNFQDCVDDEQIQFTLQMAGLVANAQVQAWASNSGATCNESTQRSGPTAVCWKVLDSNIPLQPVTSVNIPVRKIMSGAPPNNASNPDSSDKVCGKVDLTTVTTHFLYFAPGNAATAASDKTVDVQIDTVGPDPPGGLTALPGNTRITVQWNSISGGGTDGGTGGGLTSLTGVRVYCDPVGGAAAAPQPAVCTDVVVDASVDDSGDASTGGTVRVCNDGGTSSGSCSSSNFTSTDGSPIFPDADFSAKHECGAFNGNAGTTVVASQVAGAPLVNGQKYAVAVAATDAFGNAGKLSDPICETPAVTSDFWEDYKRAGGKAGNGCASSGEDAPASSLTVVGLAVAAAVSSARRRWRRDR